MKRLWMLSVWILVVGCANNGPNELTWPAQITSIQGFSNDQTTVIKRIVDNLNKEEGKQVLGLPGENISGSPITIELVDNLDDSNPSSSTVSCASGIADRGVSPLDSTTTRVAGQATVEPGQCTIKIASFIATGSSDLFEAVGTHEIGHCGGLVHVTPTLQVMSPLTVPYSDYTPDALHTFFASFLKSTGLTI